MDNFILFCLLSLLSSVLVGYWAKQWGKSAFEYGFLSFLFTPLLPAIILLMSRGGEEMQEKRSN